MLLKKCNDVRPAVLAENERSIVGVLALDNAARHVAGDQRPWGTIGSCRRSKAWVGSEVLPP